MAFSADKLEKEALEWLELVVREQIVDQTKSAQEILKDGTILCKYQYMRY